MRLIDAEVFGEKIESSINWVDINLEEDRFSEGCKASLKDLLSTLKCYTPTVDAVPVVRCKDCVYAEKGQTTDGRVWCLYFDSVMNDTGFCSNG